MAAGQTLAGPAILGEYSRDENAWTKRRKSVVKFFRTKPLGAVGFVIVLAFVLAAIFAQQLAPQGYDHRVIKDRMQTSSIAHPLGTDDTGRDVLSRIIYGARISMIVGFGTITISTLLSGFLGLVTGFFGGWLDTIIQRLIDMWIAFPFLILLLAVLAAFGTPTHTLNLHIISLQPSQQRMLQIVVVLGLLFSAGPSRVVRGAALGVRNNLYVEGARTVGASNFRILRSYILPNVLPTMIILASLGLGAAILAEATLSFLGYGIPDPVPSWGRMLSGIATARIRTDPWLSIWPGLAISLAVYGFNMFGDALRDVLDPRLRGSR